MTARSKNSGSPQTNIVFQNSHIRISVITTKIIRIEKDSFTDLPSQTVWYRDLGAIPYQWDRKGTSGYLSTQDASYEIDLKRGFLLSVKLSNGTVVKNFKKGILPGTARTLDMANGAVKLEKGILSQSGVGMLDDSKSLLLDEEKILPRKKMLRYVLFRIR